MHAKRSLVRARLDSGFYDEASGPSTTMTPTTSPTSRAAVVGSWSLRARRLLEFNVEHMLSDSDIEEEDKWQQHMITLGHNVLEELSNELRAVFETAVTSTNAKSVESNASLSKSVLSTISSTSSASMSSTSSVSSGACEWGSLQSDARCWQDTLEIDEISEEKAISSLAPKRSKKTSKGDINEALWLICKESHALEQRSLHDEYLSLHVHDRPDILIDDLESNFPKNDKFGKVLNDAHRYFRTVVTNVVKRHKDASQSVNVSKKRRLPSL